MEQGTFRDRFVEIFERLLARESVDAEAAKDMSGAFEVIASQILPATDGRYFDGAVFETLRKTPRKVEFTGEMFVGRGKEQWKEPFAATVIDKRITKQDIWIKIRVGSEVGETVLREVVFGRGSRPATRS